MHNDSQDGFTLIELLVVILIIALLAAIAIPLFLAQKNRAHEAASQSALKNAATASESYAVDELGDYSGLDLDDGTLLRDYGYRRVSGVDITVAADDSEFCITATNTRLPAGHEWQISTYNSAGGIPTPADADLC